MRRIVSFGPAAAVLVCAATALIAVPAIVLRVNAAQSQVRVTLAQATLDGDDILDRLNRAVRNVAVAVEPSVVHLDVRQSTPTIGGEETDLFLTRSTGAGWVFDSAGHIVTNAHVVRAAETIGVTFSDGRIAEGQVLATDPFTDIAVLKVDEGPFLIPARRATGERPQKGERVFAFGSPFGFKFSMSEGIVSAMGVSARSAMEFGGFTNFIQTDAAVNPGNSGGPLVDIHGRVVGMNVAIANARNARQDRDTRRDEGQSAGISFAIPLATIESVVDQLITTGAVSRGFLGINFARAPVEVRHNNEFRGVGLLVDTAVLGLAAERAGIRNGDIIVAVDGQNFTDFEILRSLVSTRKAGSVINVRVWRDGAFQELPVSLAERPRESLAVDAGGPIFARLGMVLRDDLRGVRVARSFDGGRAYESGLRSGQLVTHVASTPVRTYLDAIGAMIDAGLLDGKIVSFRVRESDDSPDTTKEIKVWIDR